MNKRLRWVRRIGWLVALALVAGSAAVYQAQLFVGERLPAYLTQRLSQALHRPVTVGSVSFWPLGAFTLHGFRVLPGPGETETPLVADRIRAYISWWDVLVHRRLWVKAVHVD